MKQTIPTIGLVVALLSPLGAQDAVTKSRQQRTTQVDTYYKQAEAAYRKGDLKTAKTAVRNALAINRNHGPSYALNIQLNKKSTNKSFQVRAREKTFASVIVPIIDFKDLPLEDALSTLSMQVEKQSKDKVIPNFVIQDPSGALKSKSVTLNMRQVPANVVLNYLMNLTGANAKFDQHAVVIRPAN